MLYFVRQKRMKQWHTHISVDFANNSSLVERLYEEQKAFGSIPNVCTKRKSRVLYGVKTASFQGESAWSDKTRKVES